MKNRAGMIIAWICVGLVAAFNVFATVMKYVPVEPGSPSEAMLQRLGLTVNMQHVFGIVEGLAVILLLVPRTSTVGFIIMVGYMAGALATNLTHGFSHLEALPIYISLALLTISAYFRNPELLARIRGQKISA